MNIYVFFHLQLLAVLLIVLLNLAICMGNSSSSNKIRTKIIRISNEQAIAAINESNIMYNSDKDYEFKFNSAFMIDSMSFEPFRVFDPKNEGYLVFYSKQSEPAEKILSDKLSNVSTAEEALNEIKKHEKIDDPITFPALKDVSVEEIEKFLSNFEFQNESFVKSKSLNSSMKIIPNIFKSYLKVYTSSNSNDTDFLNLIESSADSANKQNFTNNQDVKKYFLNEIFRQLSDVPTNDSFSYNDLIFFTTYYRIDNFKLVDNTASNSKDPEIISLNDEISEKSKVFLPFFDISDSAVAEEYFLAITKQNQVNDWLWCLQLTILQLGDLLTNHSIAKIKAKYEKRIPFTDFNKIMNQKFSKKELQMTDDDFRYQYGVTIFDFPHHEELSDFDNFKLYLKYLVSNGLLDLHVSEHQNAADVLLTAIKEKENKNKFKERLIQVNSQLGHDSTTNQSIDSSNKSQKDQNEHTAGNVNGLGNDSSGNGGKKVTTNNDGNIIVVVFILLIIVGGIVAGGVYFFYFYQKSPNKYQRY